MHTANGTNMVRPPISHTNSELGPVAAAVAVHCNVHPAVTRNSVVSRRPIARGSRDGADVDSPPLPDSSLSVSFFSGKREPPKECGILRSSGQASGCALIGSDLRRLPVAAKMALQIAGATGGTPVSPMPPGGASLGMMWMSSSGISFKRSTR